MSNSLRPSILGFSKTISEEVAKFGVTINTILPGSIKTERQMDFAFEYGKKQGKTVEEMLDKFEKASPIQRMGTTEEIGDMAAFLASEKASFITGSVIQVDGGKINSI